MAGGDAAVAVHVRVLRRPDRARQAVAAGVGRGDDLGVAESLDQSAGHQRHRRAGHEAVVGGPGFLDLGAGAFAAERGLRHQGQRHPVARHRLQLALHVAQVAGVEPAQQGADRGAGGEVRVAAEAGLDLCAGRNHCGIRKRARTGGQAIGGPEVKLGATRGVALGQARVARRELAVEGSRIDRADIRAFRPVQGPGRKPAATRNIVRNQPAAVRLHVLARQPQRIFGSLLRDLGPVLVGCRPLLEIADAGGEQHHRGDHHQQDHGDREGGGAALMAGCGGNHGRLVVHAFPSVRRLARHCTWS
jgi:hypothetical protein